MPRFTEGFETPYLQSARLFINECNRQVARDKNNSRMNPKLAGLASIADAGLALYVDLR
jgi:hypothetical protein